MKVVGTQARVGAEERRRNSGVARRTVDRTAHADRDTATATASPSRRAVVVAAAAGVVALPLAKPISALADAPDAQLTNAIRDVTKGAAVREAGVKLVMPELAENGNAVALAVTVESPMTAAEHVRRIHILSEKNPVATIARFDLGPRAGRAEVKTNVRVATSQRIIALAEMSDGSFRSGAADVVVTITACLDAG